MDIPGGKVSAGLPPKLSDVLSFGKEGNITYAGTMAAGVFKSTDYGDSWSPINNGLTAAHTRDICFDTDGTLYTANWSNGFQKSSDNGVSWKVINNGLTNVGSYSIVADDNGNLIGGTDEGIFRSTDKGEHWTKTNTAGNDFGYALHKDHLNRIYVQTYGSGVYRTTDLGESWQRIDNFVSGYTFGLASDSTGLILAGTAGGRIYRSTNYGASWSQVYYNSTFNSVIGDITPIYGDYVYATNHFVGILRSSNKGISWELVKPDTGYLFTYPALLTSEGVYAAGSEDKLYYSSDNGNKWNDITDNLGLTSFFRIREYKNRVYFATDESVWRNAIYTTSDDYDPEKDIHYNLSQNYPNPFNPSTTIEFSLPKEENVKLSLYSILGEELRVLVNEKMTAGVHKYTLDASALPSGVYMYRIKGGRVCGYEEACGY